MTEHRLEVADVFRQYGSAYLEAYGHVTTPLHKRVMQDIATCRTAALGGHKLQCDRCGHDKNSYNSCRNRHCTKCQAAATARWLEAKQADLLPVPYFHVVFTLPDKLRPIALQNKRVVYGMLFRAASQTLRQIARDPKHLGADIGFLANKVRREKLALCRKLLGQTGEIVTITPPCTQAEETTDTCPVCRKGRMIIVTTIQPQAFSFDTS